MSNSNNIDSILPNPEKILWRITALAWGVLVPVLIYTITVLGPRSADGVHFILGANVCDTDSSDYWKFIAMSVLVILYVLIYALALSASAQYTLRRYKSVSLVFSPLKYQLTLLLVIFLLWADFAFVIDALKDTEECLGRFIYPVGTLLYVGALFLLLLIAAIITWEPFKALRKINNTQSL